MKKLSFTEKNNFVLRHKAAKYFSIDLDLFRRTYLTHKLNTDLARANIYTYERLDGQMLYVLLDVVSPEEILANRSGSPLPTPGDETPRTPPTDPAPQDPAVGEETPRTPPTDPAPQDPAVGDEIKALKERIDELEGNDEINRDEIDSLRLSLDDSESSVEELRTAVEALEKKAFNKKKASEKSSRS